jgi:hypothetical protein
MLKLFDVMRILISPAAGRFKEIFPAGVAKSKGTVLYNGNPPV